VSTSRSVRYSLGLAFVAMLAGPTGSRAFQAAPPSAGSPPAPVRLTSEEDHQRLMGLLHMTEIRPGKNGSNRDAPNYANYDESKANPYPNLPDPLGVCRR